MTKEKKSKALKLNGFWAQVQRYNYRQAFEKILFTMIGLWLALWLNNVNDHWKRNRDEKQILRQLDAALKQDLDDIKETIVGYQYRVDGASTILNSLGAASKMTDTLRSALQSLNGYSFLSANKGAYETLKSRGMDLIRNDTLRLRIASLYEVDYLITERSEAFFQKIYCEQFIPYIFTNLTWAKAGLDPVDWEKARNDNYFRQMVIGALYNNQNILGLYKQLQKDVRTLSEDIQEDLDFL